MLSYVHLYTFLIKAAFALQIPRQATVSYGNSSTSVHATAPTTTGPDCCEVYAAGVFLNWWYTGHNVTVNNGTLITEYMKYNDTIVPISTITVPPTSTLSPGTYGAGNGINPIIPGVPTDLVGAVEDGDYLATIIEPVADTGNSTTTAVPAPFMDFEGFYVIAGYTNSKGVCMNAPVGSFAISSVAQTWFPMVAEFPYDLSEADIVGASVAGVQARYSSNVSSSQISTWHNTVVTTELDEKLFAWLTKQPSVLSQVPYIMSCSPVSAAGAPQLHIRVSYLTASSAVTSTTNAMYFSAAATTSASPASKTLPIVSNTQAPTSNVPSPTTVEVSAETASGAPVQPAESQKAGASSAVPSAGSENQPTQPTTVQGASAPTNQPAPSNTKGAPSNAPSQQPTQPTVTHEAIAPSATSAQEAADNPTQPGTSQGAPFAGTSHAPSIQPDQSTTIQKGGQAGSSQADSNTRVVQSSVPAVVVIGDATATVISSTGLPAEITTSNTGGHIVDTAANTRLAQASGTVVVGSSQPTSGATAYTIEGQTLKPGGSAVEVSGTTYSIQESGGVVVNGNTIPILTVVPQTSLPPTPVVIGELTATPVASDTYIVAGQTLNRGGSAVEISGTTYSLPPSASNAVIDGQTAPISTIQASLESPATVVIGGVTAKPESSGAYYLVADQTLSPGGLAIEVSGVTYSLPTSGANIMINGATSIMAQSNIATVSAAVFGSATAVPLLAGGYVVGSQIISPGGSAVDISGTVYSLPSSGSSVIVDGKPTAIQAVAPNDAVLTLGTQAYTAVAASATPLVVASQTLIPGGSDITVGGTTFSLPPDASGSIVVNGQTTSLAKGASGGFGLPSGSMDLSFTPLSSGIIVASQTLYPGGPAIVVQGETLSIPGDGSAVVIQSGTTATTKGLGGYIWQGIASTASSSASLSTSIVDASSTTAISTGSSTRAVVESSQAAVPTGSGSTSSTHTSTSDASGQQSASSIKPATMALVICMFAIVLW